MRKPSYSKKKRFEFNFAKPGDHRVPKVVVELKEFESIGDGLLQAIQSYNQNHNASEQISDDLALYKLRLAKTDGQADFDMPTISKDLRVDACEWARFAIVLEGSHFVLPGVLSIENSKEEKLLEGNKQRFDYEVEKKGNEGGFCCCLLACFGCKKKK